MTSEDYKDIQNEAARKLGQMKKRLIRKYGSSNVDKSVIIREINILQIMINELVELLKTEDKK
ncbi:hypothetical protein [Francisella philomiragia]|uniref:hypothetical protein n=1 Tax=Francisella philomiragia TaxID=28110 RepID=UPI001C9D8E3C|nr:hypothetical protein [Francisella philomiragia]MBY7733468.1 hypothetical protein [Francisella philomiragia]